MGCGWQSCLDCPPCTMATTTITSTTSSSTTTAMHCVGTDSRCEGKGEEQCMELDGSGAHCRWEPVVPETTGECVGNDSRCRGAPRTWCERLSLNSDCAWRRKCQGWCAADRHALVNWAVKCTWDACQGCHQCDARRLQGTSAEEVPSRDFLV